VEPIEDSRERLAEAERTAITAAREIRRMQTLSQSRRLSKSEKDSLAQETTIMMSAYKVIEEEKSKMSSGKKADAPVSKKEAAAAKKAAEKLAKEVCVCVCVFVFVVVIVGIVVHRCPSTPTCFWSAYWHACDAEREGREEAREGGREGSKATAKGSQEPVEKGQSESQRELVLRRNMLMGVAEGASRSTSTALGTSAIHRQCLSSEFLNFEFRRLLTFGAHRT
jgi:hypothetical protein